MLSNKTKLVLGGGCFVLLLVFCVCCAYLLYRRAKNNENSPSFTNITTIEENGGRVDWSMSSNLIAYDRKGDDGYYDVWTVRPDGSGDGCITCQMSEISEANVGNPEWHTSGDYMVVQVENPDLSSSSGLFLTSARRYSASPGVGINNNLWIITADGSDAWQLTDIDDGYGTLHPQFSSDGTKLLWSEIVRLSEETKVAGYWAIKVADFSIDEGNPIISNIQTITPGNECWYETHGFSSDGSSIIYTAFPDGGYFFDTEIYTYHLQTGEIVQMTDNDEWDEHAHYSPDGTKIIWSSSSDIDQDKVFDQVDILKHPTQLDLWIMNSDGSEKERVTFLNETLPNEYYSLSLGGGLGDGAWSPEGTKYVVKMRAGRGTEQVILIDLGEEFL